MKPSNITDRVCKKFAAQPAERNHFCFPVSNWSVRRTMFQGLEILFFNEANKVKSSILSD